MDKLGETYMYNDTYFLLVELDDEICEKIKENIHNTHKNTQIHIYNTTKFNIDIYDNINKKIFVISTNHEFINDMLNIYAIDGYIKI